MCNQGFNGPNCRSYTSYILKTTIILRAISDAFVENKDHNNIHISRFTHYTPFKKLRVPSLKRTCTDKWRMVNISEQLLNKQCTILQDLSSDIKHMYISSWFKNLCPFLFFIMFYIKAYIHLDLIKN